MGGGEIGGVSRDKGERERERERERVTKIQRFYDRNCILQLASK